MSIADGADDGDGTGLEDSLLLDAIEGRLSPAETETVRARVAADPALKERFDSYARTVDALRHTTIARPSPALRAALEALLPKDRILARAFANAKVSMARFMSEVNGGAAFAGARGAGLEAKRQCLFDLNDGAELIVTIEPEESGVRVSGQVLGADPQRVVTLTTDGALVSVEADEYGQFDAVLDATAVLVVDVSIADRRTIVDLTEFLDRR